MKCFREKPNPELAEQFLRQGGFSWNAGMFVWSLPTVIRQLASPRARSSPRFISELRDARRSPPPSPRSFPQLPARSIDYALMENADRVLNIEATFDWDDVGSWISDRQVSPEPTARKTTPTTPITEIDSENNIVFNARPGSRIALLGVDDLIVVQTEDALLIANRHQADAIKQLGALLPGELL